MRYNLQLLLNQQKPAGGNYGNSSEHGSIRK
jgi:hypothetical protein